MNNDFGSGNGSWGQDNNGQNNGYQGGYGYQQNQYGYVDESGLFSENKLKRRNGVSARLTLGDWMKVDCFAFLNLIPIFGQIALIVIYCILAFSSKTAISLKTRYQASLIWAGIILAFYVMLIVLLIALGVSFAGISAAAGARAL